MGKIMYNPDRHTMGSKIDFAPSAVIIALTVLKRHSTRFLNVAVRTCAHSVARALARSGTDARLEGGQLAFQFVLNALSGLRSVHRPFKIFHTNQSKCL